MLAEEVAPRAAHAAAAVAHQVDDQGAAGPVRVRRRQPPARLATAATSASRTSTTTSSRACCGRPSRPTSQAVLLIDEIDKADIEFPNDLLRELDRMEFYVYETRRRSRRRHRPLVIITSNNEKELPDAFLRRCFFHYIKFPDKDTMQEIVDVHFPKLRKELLKNALDAFFDVRDLPGLKKKPSTSELLDWLKLLVAEDIPPEALRSRTTSCSCRRSPARCSRTNRTCTCSRAWCSWRATTAEAPRSAHDDRSAARHPRRPRRPSRAAARRPPRRPRRRRRRRRALEALVHLGARARATSTPTSPPR